MADTIAMSIPVARLNHAVLFVRDAAQAAEFYGRVFGFEVVANEFGGKAVFMRSAGGDNHHDLGLFTVGPEAPRAPRDLLIPSTIFRRPRRGRRPALT